MMEMTKRKMVLEHLVVGKLKGQNINQEELDDIITYGSKELFSDENDEEMKSGQIHYDDAAIDRLLNRDYTEEENAAMDEEEEDGFLKAFKVVNFEAEEALEKIRLLKLAFYQTGVASPCPFQPSTNTQKSRFFLSFMLINCHHGGSRHTPPVRERQKSKLKVKGCRNNGYVCKSRLKMRLFKSLTVTGMEQAIGE